MDESQAFGAKETIRMLRRLYLADRKYQRVAYRVLGTFSARLDSNYYQHRFAQD